MPVEPVLNFDELLQPIPGPDPAGKTRAGILDEIKELRKDKDPDPHDPNDRGKSADWSGVVELAQQTLIETSKDVRVAAYLAEALAKLHQFQGIRDGLRLLRLLVENCWDRLNPPIEDDDLELRTRALELIDLPHGGFP